MELKYVYTCALVEFSSTFTLVISFPSLSLVKQTKNQTLGLGTLPKGTMCVNDKKMCLFCRLSPLKDVNSPSSPFRRIFRSLLHDEVRNRTSKVCHALDEADPCPLRSFQHLLTHQPQHCLNFQQPAPASLVKDPQVCIQAAGSNWEFPSWGER